MENTKLSADEILKHWLLNLGIEVPVWLGLLFPAVEGEALNAKPVPYCNVQDYARGLIELFYSRLITLSSEVSGDDVESRSGILRILDRFLKLTKEDSTLRRDGRLLPPHERNRLPAMQVSFELTALGGQAWERVAEPDWEHIVYDSGDLTSEELISPDRDRLIAYMGWYPEIYQKRIELDTITWQTQTDFAILYWKRLHVVYHVSFKFQPAKEQWAVMAPMWFRDWHSSTRKWHKKPWGLPGWPSE